MGALEIIVLVGAIALVAFTLIYNIVKRRKGKNSCTGCTGCCNCPSAQKCGQKKGK